MPIELGAVYQWKWPTVDKPNRVLLYDANADMVMTDDWSLIPGERWMLGDVDQARKERHINYTASHASSLLEDATYLRTEPLTDEEITLHRPDLPFSPFAWDGANWPTDVAATLAEFRESDLGSIVALNAEGRLNVSEIYLCPFGRKGGTRAGKKVTADDGVAFTLDELVWKAADLQKEYMEGNSSAQGMGIYREGLRRGIPSFYLRGALSQLDEYERDRLKRQI